jgi:magnesium transporter
MGIIRHMSWRLGLIGGLSMVFALSVGCFVGAALPLLLDRLKRDPATGSTIFLTMVTDSSAFLTFLGMVWLLQTWVFLG